MSYIIDISEHQQPSLIRYDELVKELDLAIVRVQYGADYEDRSYKTHIKELKKRGIPVAVYAWVRGLNVADMEAEAKTFYERAKNFNPTFWFLDVEERSMSNMVIGCEAYRAKLKQLGAKQVGIYVANHLYNEFGFSTEAINKYDAVWIPTYGGLPTCLAYSQIDLHQYTSTGRIKGYDYDVDLSKLTGKSSLAKFTGNEKQWNQMKGGKHKMMYIYQKSLKNGRQEIWFVNGEVRMWLPTNTYVKEAEDLIKRYGGSTNRTVYNYDNFGLKMIEKSTKEIKLL